MRKQLKKKCSCAMCKPHKMHGANRWKVTDHDDLVRAEKETREARGRRGSDGEHPRRESPCFEQGMVSGKRNESMEGHPQSVEGACFVCGPDDMRGI